MEIIYLSLYCHHQNDSRIKMDRIWQPVKAYYTDGEGGAGRGGYL